MRKLCSKHGKGGKIHPVRSASSSVAGGGDDPMAAALCLLPAAILVIFTALGPEDQEVLAHFVTRPLNGDVCSAGAAPPSEQGGLSAHFPYLHPPTLGCGCFECYGSFWLRWGRSPQCCRIGAALDALDEHFLAAESTAKSPPSLAKPPPTSAKRRDKGKRHKPPVALPPPPPLPLPQSPPPRPVPAAPKSPEPQAVEALPEPFSLLPSPILEVPTPAAFLTEEENVPEPTVEAEAEEDEAAEQEEEGRKRGWAGVLGLHLWGIWNPPVESAT
ncbi:hypothetical protein ACP4OV_005752 [Aristida adscensionis]